MLEQKYGVGEKCKSTPKENKEDVRVKVIRELFGRDPKFMKK